MSNLMIDSLAYDDPDYEAFRYGSNNMIHGNAMHERHNNQYQHRRAIGSDALRAGWAAGWRAGLTALGGGLFIHSLGAAFGGHEAAAAGAAPTPTGTGASNGIQIPPMHELNLADTGPHHVQYWHLDQINGNTGLSGDALTQASYADFHNGWDALAHNGFGGDIAHNYGVNPPTYWIEGATTPDGGVWMYYQGNLTHIAGGVQMGNESLTQLLHAANHGAQFFPGNATPDQVAHMFGTPMPDASHALALQPDQLAEYNDIVSDFRQRYLDLYGVEPVAGTVNVAQAQQVLHDIIAQHAAAGTLNGATLPPSSFPSVAQDISSWTGVPQAYIVAELERIRLALAA
jgi:hypothetical protein